MSLKYSCKMCDMNFSSEEERDNHEQASKHCPRCGEHQKEVEWTSKNVHELCKLCKAERADYGQVLDC